MWSLPRDSAVAGGCHEDVVLNSEMTRGRSGRFKALPVSAVVAIDDVTFSDLDLQWPFPRSRFGKVVTRLHAAGAKEIVLDVQFTEETTPREDFALYRSIERAGGAV